MTEAERFRNWFHQATGHCPYHYQTRLAGDENMLGLLRVPTGLGKTAGAAGVESDEGGHIIH